MDGRRVVSQITVWGLFLILVVGCTVPLPIPTGTFSQPSADDILPTPAPTPDPASILEEGGVIATIATRSLRVRSEPTDNSDVVAGVAEGETYRVVALSDDGLWVQIAIDSAADGTGWVSTSFVSVQGEITSLTEPEETAGAALPVNSTAGLTLVPTPEAGFARVSTGDQRLRVRSGPGLENTIVGYVYDGERYPVLESSADGQWVQIPASSGANPDNSSGGWVAAEFLVVGN